MPEPCTPSLDSILCAWNLAKLHPGGFCDTECENLVRICVRDCGLGAVIVVLVEFRHCEVGDEMLRILLKPKIGTPCPENTSGRGATRLELWVALKSPLVECSSKRIRNTFIQGDFIMCWELSAMCLWQTK